MPRLDFLRLQKLTPARQRIIALPVLVLIQDIHAVLSHGIIVLGLMTVTQSVIVVTGAVKDRMGQKSGRLGWAF
jgi:hypothetical protein